MRTVSPGRGQSYLIAFHVRPGVKGPWLDELEDLPGPQFTSSITPPSQRSAAPVVEAARREQT
jgi:hypothetical protein